MKPLLVLAAIAALCAAAFLYFSKRGKDERPDVILVSIDTLRADHCGFVTGSVRDPGGRSLTPHLDAVASRALPWREGLSPCPLTLPAHASLFSGLYPDRTMIRENDSFRVPKEAERGYPLLAELLRNAGYDTLAFVSGQPLERAQGLDAGFRVYDQPSRDLSIADPMAFRERSAKETNARIEETVDLQKDQPLFLFVHYFDPHHPYLRGREDEDLPKTPRGGYAAEVRATDREFGRLLAFLEGRKRPRVLVVVSDHGEGLGDHGEETHGFLLQESTLRVPFLVVADLPRVPEPVSLGLPRLVDVTPTLLDLLRIGPEGTLVSDGRSLFAAASDWNAAAETLYPYYQLRGARLRAFYDQERKLVEGGGERQVFRWTGPSCDEKEVEEPDAERRLVRGLFAHLARPEVGRSEGVAVRADAANSYFGGRPLEAPVEPTEEENRTLPHPRTQFPLVRSLEAAREAIRAGAPAEAEALLWPELERHPQNPSLLFWAARAADLVARDGRMSAEARLVQIDQKAKPLYERHARDFDDGRAEDALLRLGLLRHQVSGARQDLLEVVSAATREIDAGDRRPLLFVFRGQAKEGLGDGPGALADFETAARLDPDDPRIRGDVDRLTRAR